MFIIAIFLSYFSRVSMYENRTKNELEILLAAYFYQFRDYIYDEQRVRPKPPPRPKQPNAPPNKRPIHFPQSIPANGRDQTLKEVQNFIPEDNKLGGNSHLEDLFKSGQRAREHVRKAFAPPIILKP